jgi:hypothetical protein
MMVDAYSMDVRGICRDGTTLLSRHTSLPPTASRQLVQKPTITCLLGKPLLLLSM